MASTPACTPKPTPEPELELEPVPDIDLTTFDWTLIRTPSSTIRYPHRKPDRAIQLQCTTKLRSIDTHFGNPSGLSSLVEGTRVLMTRSWKTFHLYFAFDAEFPDCERLWSRTEWRKWDLVEFLTRICEQYHSEVLRAEREGVELVTQRLDEEFLSLVEVLLSLGSEGEDVVGIKEWERNGTMKTLKTKVLSAEDVKISKERKQDAEEEEDSAKFEGLELGDALPDTHASPASEPPGGGWNVALALRDSMTPGVGL
jgi:hypothetical protein